MTALDVSTLAIAVVGAVTGVAALATQVWGLLIAGPRIRVTVANAFVPIGSHTGSLTWALSLDASNVGRLPVTILEAGTMFRAAGDWKKAPLGMMPDDSWHGERAPYRLVDGEAATMDHGAGHLGSGCRAEPSAGRVRIRAARDRKDGAEPQANRHHQLGHARLNMGVPPSPTCP